MDTTTEDEYPYQRLLPDIWSECLSYLLPQELSMASKILPLHATSETTANAEHAAWLSLVWMVEQTNNSNGNSNNYQEESIFRDDTNLFQKETGREQKLKPNRFRDETWLNLYGFMFRVLQRHCEQMKLQEEDDDDENDESDNDEENEILQNEIHHPKDTNHPYFHHANREAIGLLVGLVFGTTTTTTRVRSQTAHETLRSIAVACTHIATFTTTATSSSTIDATLAPQRAHGLSLRLATEGFWDQASTILEGYQDDNSMDGMICVSTFLIDRLYSQTYVKVGTDDEELATAVRLGRMAVKLAQERCHQETKTKTTTTATAAAAAAVESATTEVCTLVPPLPMESLFENDIDRCVHAKLALGKALSLLAQHIGLGASDHTAIRILPETIPIQQQQQNQSAPTLEMRQEQQSGWAQRIFGFSPKRVSYTLAFFQESQRHFQEAMQENQYNNNPVLAAILQSAEAERQYCFASASTAFRWEHSLQHYGESAVRSFSKTFSELVQQAMTNPKPATLGALIRCGKDYGKTCGFCEAYGISIGRNDKDNFLDPKIVFDLVHLLSIRRHGFFHPTTKNIERLSQGHRQQQQVSQNNPSMGEIYASVRKWLNENYGTSS